MFETKLKKSVDATNSDASKIIDNKKWDEAIAKAKEIYCGRNKSQMEIARLALEVCEISWGGSKYKNCYTLKKFAEETGIAAKRLSEWIVVYKNVFNRLPDPTVREATYTNLLNVAMRVNRDTPLPVLKKTFDETVNRSGLDNTLVQYLGSIRSTNTLFQRRNAALKANKKTVAEVFFYCNQICKTIRKETDIQPENHGLASTTIKSRSLSVASVFGIERSHNGEIIKTKDGREVKITPKDRDIIGFLKRTKSFVSPTDIGVKLKGHSRSSGSAWACRTLNKLMQLEYVERNKFGHYKWVG